MELKNENMWQIILISLNLQLRIHKSHWSRKKLEITPHFTTNYSNHFL
jgi:hypothetical protein